MPEIIKTTREMLERVKTRRKQRHEIETWDLDTYPDISNAPGAIFQTAAGTSFQGKNLKKVRKSLGWRPSALDDARAITVILQKEENKHATGGEAVAIYYYEYLIGHVKERNLRGVKNRMTKLAGDQPVKADARLRYLEVENIIENPVNMYLEFTA